MFQKFKQYKRNQQKKTIFAALIAGVAGAVAAIFLTPFSGKEARSKVKEKAGELTEQAKVKATQTRDQLTEASQKVANTIKSNVEKVEAGTEKVEDKVRRASSAAKDELEK
jgi:gas vesicle protein